MRLGIHCGGSLDRNGQKLALDLLEDRFFGMSGIQEKDQRRGDDGQSEKPREESRAVVDAHWREEIAREQTLDLFP